MPPACAGGVGRRHAPSARYAALRAVSALASRKVRQARIIGGYFYQGPLTETWSFSTAPAHMRDRHQPFTIIYARRTLAGWLGAVLAADLIIEAIAEPHADEQTAATHPEVADSRIAPYFLIVRPRKP